MDTTPEPHQKPLYHRLGAAIVKTWVTITSVIGSLVLATFLMGALILNQLGSEQSSAFSQKVIHSGTKDKVAIIHIDGVISDGEGSGNALSFDPSTTSASDLTALLDEANKDASIKAVILRINSPGGAVVASDEVFRQVIEVKANKPVVASLADTAASGGYYIASGASKIIANPATITGSIGVIMELPKLQELYQKIGVEMRTFKTGEFKDIGSENRDLTLAETDLLKSIMDDSYNQFIQAIVKGRNMPEDKVRSLADGRIFSGIQAQKNGLIDQLGSYSDAVNTAATLAKITNPTVIEYSKDSLLSSLLGAKATNLNLFSLIGTTKPKVGLNIMYLMSL